MADAAGQPDLVADCNVLLESRNQLAGSASLNWSEDIPIAQWDGVSLGGTPLRVTRLNLEHKACPGRYRDRSSWDWGDCTFIATDRPTASIERALEPHPPDAAPK